MELRRNARDHCFIPTVELDQIWPDRIARRGDLYRVAEETGFALAWYDEHIGAIFIDPGVGAAPAIRRVRAENRPRVSRNSPRRPSNEKEISHYKPLEGPVAN